MTQAATKIETTEITRAQFEARFAEFLVALQKYWDDSDPEILKCRDGANGHYQVVEYDRGTKYIRIISKHTVGDSRSSYCFLDYQGNIYKCAGWKAPAKHIRGSIFDDNFSIGKGLGRYGAAYMR